MTLVNRLWEIVLAWGFWLAVLVVLSLALAIAAVLLALAPMLIVLWLAGRLLYWSATRIAMFCNAEAGGRRHCWAALTDLLIFVAIGGLVYVAVRVNLLWLDRLYQWIAGAGRGVLGLKEKEFDGLGIAAGLDWIAGAVSEPVVAIVLGLSLLAMFARVRGEARRLTAIERAP